MPSTLSRSVRAIVASLFVAQIASAQASQPLTKPARAPAVVDVPTELDARVRAIAVEPQGPFVDVGNGRLVCAQGDQALASDDGGRTWTASPLFAADAPMKVRPEQALIKTRDGTLVLVFLNDLDKRWKWDSKTNAIDGDVWLRAHAIRSDDGGKTWSSPVLVMDGYSGAVRDMVQADNGNLVVPITVFNKAGQRHMTVPYYSTDDGRTWAAAGALDVGGRGHHDGSIEATLVPRRDGSLWMLLRTSRDAFYESISTDGGATWSTIAPTTIAASSSPGLVKRLASGRLALLWNRIEQEKGTPPPRRGGQHAATMASWQRAELSIAFSDDDGKSWTPPAVIARKPGKWISYPYLLEREPGLLWITTMQGSLRCELREADFVTPSN